MLLGLKQPHPGATAFAPAMTDDTGIPSGLPATAGTPVQVVVEAVVGPWMPAFWSWPSSRAASAFHHAGGGLLGERCLLRARHEKVRRAAVLEGRRGPVPG
jgi:hypothetical protein